MNIQIIIFDGFDELDVVAPFEVLRMVAALKPGIQTQIVALDPSKPVVACNGMQVQPQARLGELKPDLVIVPGGGWIDRAPKGAWTEAQRGVLPAALTRLHADGVTLASVCTGAMLLSAAGLMTGRAAVTHHMVLEELASAGAQIIRARVVDDGEMITAGGITSGLDLALWIIERFVDAKTAQAIETRLEYERRGTVWRRSKQ